MSSAAVFLSILFLFLVEVHSQSFPYVSFMGQTLANHSYMDLSLVGNNDSHSLQCHTDLSTCCRGTYGVHRGDWFFPDGSRLPFNADTHEYRRAQGVYLYRRGGVSPSGLYLCTIHTSNNSVRARMYVGLYAGGGDILISESVILTVDSDLNEASPQFTLSCISTGGPATTVTWTRDSTTVAEGNETVLNDPVTAQYTHTLTVTGRLGGLYTCIVANNKPSNASATITVQAVSGPSHVTAVQSSLSSVLVSWIPSSGATGYRIYYENSGGDSGSATVSGGSTNSHNLTGLQKGHNYTISILATSVHFFSSTVQTHITLATLSVSVTPSTKSLSVSWRLSGGLTDATYTISYHKNSITCFNDSRSGITTRKTTYNLTRLEEEIEYSVMVVAMLSNGGELFAITNATTLTAVPSASPNHVRVTAKNSTSIIVHWLTVQCRHQNGRITGYSVRYGEKGSGVRSRTIKVVEGWRQSSTTISGLSKESIYTAQVAAITSAGTGVYSYRLTVETPPVNVFLSLNGTIIKNHSYVDIHDITLAHSNSLFCHTDLTTCCSVGQGSFRGDWYFPNGTRLIFSGVIVEARKAQRVALRRNGSSSATGMYRCDIPTNAVHDENDKSVRDSFFVGVYADGGGHISISGGLTLSDLNEASPQFTLSCISTGGPATRVAWTRDSTTVAEGNETVLNDQVTAQYTHTLTVTESFEGLYACTVANSVSKATSPVMNITALSVSEMFGAVPGEREVVFSWSPPPVTQSNGVTVTSYTLSCSPSPSSLPKSLSSQSDSLTVTGFSPNTHYSCSLVANNPWSSGPPANTSFTTQQDYSYFQLRISSVVPCPQLILSSTEQKLSDISTAIFEQLKSSCVECSNKLTIDNQFFVCYPESPSFLTYRARLEGTSETNSSFLVSLIDEWVRGGEASVIVTGVLMTVDPHCSVPVSSLDQPQCSPPPTTTTTSAAAASSSVAIIAGITGVIIILVGITIVIILLKMYRRGVKTPNASVQYGSTGGITTATNKAYGNVIRGERNDDYELVDIPPREPAPLPSVVSSLARSTQQYPPPNAAEGEIVYAVIPGDI